MQRDVGKGILPGQLEGLSPMKDVCGPGPTGYFYDDGSSLGSFGCCNASNGAENSYYT